MSEGQRHHYIPEFYLQQWGDPSEKGQLHEYRRRYKGVEPRLRYPAGTGYARGLYTFDELKGDSRDFLETVFLLKADDGANDALQRLLKFDVNLDVNLRSAWSRFIMTLFYRNPEAVQRLRTKIATELPSALNELKADWAMARREGDPVTFEEYATAMPRRDVQQATLMLLHKIMDSDAVGRLLNNMVWAVLTFHRLRHPLLTSDRPYVMTNGLDKPDGHLVMPISPNLIFVAARNTHAMCQLDAMIKRDDQCMAEKLNDIVARQSHTFVWANNSTQSRFIAKRLGERQRSMPME